MPGVVRESTGGKTVLAASGFTSALPDRPDKPSTLAWGITAPSNRLYRLLARFSYAVNDDGAPSRARASAIRVSDFPPLNQ